MDSWRNRKTLILSRTDMMGLVTPAERALAAGVGVEKKLIST